MRFRQIIPVCYANHKKYTAGRVQSYCMLKRLYFLFHQVMSNLIMEVGCISETSVYFNETMKKAVIFRSCEISSSHGGEYDIQNCLLGWRQYAPLKRRSTIILHGSTSQKTIVKIFRSVLSSCLTTNTPCCYIITLSCMDTGFRCSGPTVWRGNMCVLPSHKRNDSYGTRHCGVLHGQGKNLAGFTQNFIHNINSDIV
jgi:hypothetical protein